MITPFVFPRVEKCRHKSGVRVDARQIGAFLQIAVPAGERQIVKLVRPAVLSGNDVLDVERTAVSRLRQMAILATIAGASADRGRSAHSCMPLNSLPGLRLPVGEKIADIDVRFQLSFFVVGQLTLVSPGIELRDSYSVFLREIESQDAFCECLSHSVPGQVEYPQQNVGVWLGAKHGSWSILL